MGGARNSLAGVNPRDRRLIVTSVLVVMLIVVVIGALLQ